MYKVLVVDDEPVVLELLSDLLEGEGYVVCLAKDGLEGKALAEREIPDVVITDLELPGLDGLGVVDACMGLRPRPAVVMITGHGTVDTAVEALRKGAYDYILKPFRNEKILHTVQQCVEARTLQRENTSLKQQLRERYDPDNLVVASEPMQELIRFTEKIGPTEANVLIFGETGSGKEVVARLVHSFSPQAEGPFVAVNCAALSETLLESELFGHAKGAFTGAVSDKEGLFEAANGGTLFLDEVGEIQAPFQAKLLRVIETGEFHRVGETAQRYTHVRVVSATNRDLERAVAEGKFREDLYYRLGVLTVEVPPLRERPEDILPLATHLLRRLSAATGRILPAVSEEAARLLEAHRWPGNVRQLENVLQRAFALCEDDTIEARDLPGFQGDDGDEGDLVSRRFLNMPYGEAKQQVVDIFERRYLTNALDASKGNVSAAAERSGISRQSLQKIMRRHDFKSTEFK